MDRNCIIMNFKILLNLALMITISSEQWLDCLLKNLDIVGYDECVVFTFQLCNSWRKI